MVSHSLQYALNIHSTVCTVAEYTCLASELTNYHTLQELKE